MKNYVQFFAKGIIYSRDKNGEPIGLKEVRKGNGVTLNCPEIMGKVFMQCPNLLPCDHVDIDMNPIM